MPVESEEERHLDGMGASSYRVTRLTSFHVERPEMNPKKELKLDGNPVLDTVNWIWTEFSIAGGRDFYQTVLEPFSGNYRSIEANAAAWRQIGLLFGELVGNMAGNLTKLGSAHWTGPASEALQQFIRTYWTEGATFVAGKVGEFVAQGFDKLGDLSRAIATAIEAQIRSIVEAATRIASRAFFGLGWARTLIEYLAELFGEAQTLHEDIQKLIDAFGVLTNLETAVKDMVEAAKAYLGVLHQIMDTVTKIPDVQNLEDAQRTYGDIQKGVGDLNAKRAEIEEKGKQIATDIGDLDKRVRSRIGRT